MSDDIDNAIASFCDRWNRAEKAIKLAEQINGRIVNPSIYELRCAGRRIVESFEALKTDPGQSLKLIGDAEFDCCRAQHDAIDAATAKIASDLEIAIQKIGAHNVLQFFPEYPSLVGDLGEILDRISVSRENRDDRDKIYESIQTGDLSDLVKKYNKFRRNEPLLKKAARRERTIFWAAIIFGITGVMGTIYTIATFYSGTGNPPSVERAVE